VASVTIKLRLTKEKPAAQKNPLDTEFDVTFLLRQKEAE